MGKRQSKQWDQDRIPNPIKQVPLWDRVKHRCPEGWEVGFGNCFSMHQLGRMPSVLKPIEHGKWRLQSWTESIVFGTLDAAVAYWNLTVGLEEPVSESKFWSDYRKAHANTGLLMMPIAPGTIVWRTSSTEHDSVQPMQQ